MACLGDRLNLLGVHLHHTGFFLFDLYRLHIKLCDLHREYHGIPWSDDQPAAQLQVRQSLIESGIVAYTTVSIKKAMRRCSIRGWGLRLEEQGGGRY